VRNSAVKIDLIGQTSLLEDGLALVALLRREDCIGLSGSDRQWALNNSQLLRGHGTRMSDIPGINLADLQVSYYIFGTEAVAHPADAL
jgi:hypothetical protein